MCKTPNRLPDGTQTACRRCSLCLANRTNDLVGRAIAESRVADRTLSVTLTYAGDSVKNVVHCVEDVQKMVRAQRDAGLNVRYMIAGEFGEKFGRVHWHAVLFWRGENIPQVDLDRRVDWSFWPHGYSYFQQPDYKGLAYALKYAVKDSAPGSVRPFTLSKKPPIGHDFFVDMAMDMAAKALPLHEPSYRFRDVRTGKGEIRTFWLHGKMREVFVKTYLNHWAFLEFRDARGLRVPQTPWLFGEALGEGYFYKMYPDLSYDAMKTREWFEMADGNARLSRNVDKRRLGALWSQQDMINRAERGL